MKLDELLKEVEDIGLDGLGGLFEEELYMYFPEVMVA